MTITDFNTLRERGCVVVDTTCGSVLNVWKRVEAYARDGFTSLIHGKHYHEETRATASQVEKFPGGTYLVVRNMDEAKEVCAYIEDAATDVAFVAEFAKSASRTSTPTCTCCASASPTRRRCWRGSRWPSARGSGAGDGGGAGRSVPGGELPDFRHDLHATQDRQDAVNALLQEPLDVMIVVGGYNSSNTLSLAALCAERVRTFHVEDALCIDPERGTIFALEKFLNPAKYGWNDEVDYKLNKKELLQRYARRSGEVLLRAAGNVFSLARNRL